MSILLKVFLLFSLAKFISTAIDYKVLNFTCKSCSDSIITFSDCGFYNRSIFMTLNVTKPINPIYVSPTFLKNIFENVYFYNLQIKVEFFFRTGDDFQPIYKAPLIDWCKFVKENSKTKPFLQMLLDSIKSSAPQLFHPCPYYGSYDTKNITLRRNFLPFFPSGPLMTTLSVSNETGELVNLRVLILIN